MRAPLFCALATLWLSAPSISCAPAPPPASAPPAVAVDPVPTLRRDEARVEQLRAIGPYLEASLVGRAGRQSFLFVASESCRRALSSGAVVRLTPARPLVLATGAGGVKCAARGIGRLAEWRDTLPDRRASFLVVTKPAELRLVSEASGYLLATGQLPLALELRWPEPTDVAAVLPDTPACRRHLARGRTVMEFRPQGEDALVLRGRLEPCPILAIAEPVFLD